jgi:CHAT domain-containing protein
MQLNIASPFALNYNLVALAQNPFFTETRQLALEAGLLSLDLEDLEGKQRGAALWKMVQHFKGTVLSHRCGQRIPEQLLKRIQESPEAWRLYQEEQRIINEGPQSRMDYRLQTHQAKMASCPELKALIERRLARGITMEQATSLVTKTVRWSKTVIMVDWFLYRGYFFILGYNTTAGKLCMIQHIEEPTCTVPKLEEWIERNLNVEGDMLLQTLETSRELWKLHHLTDAIRLNCSPGDTLIFSPTLCLNRIPLHAIPYKDQNDHPIIHYHPVIYMPSGGILKECVERALDIDPRAQVRAKLFDFYDRDEEDYVEEQMGELAAILGEMGAEPTVTARNGISRTALMEVLTEADIVHFHGHVNGQNLDKYLVLGDDDATDASASSNRSGPSASHTQPSSQGQEPQPSAGSNSASVPGGFALQDVYAVTMRARLVLLMGCGSSELEVSRGDDALGLVNGFLAAGAATVVGTLWPFGADSARVFSRHFYRNAFGREALSAKQETHEEDADGDKAMQLVDMAMAMQTSVRTMRQCVREKCVKRRSPDARLKCHRVPPYEWAPFVAWGSWVYRTSRWNKSPHSSLPEVNDVPVSPVSN